MPSGTTGTSLRQMGLLCSRIGCSSKAAASLQFNASQSTAILVDLTPSFGGMPLCENHANSRTAPVGWNIVDRRTGAGNLAVWSSEEEAPAKSAPPAQRPPSRRPQEAPAAARSAAAAQASTNESVREPETAPKPEPAAAEVAEEQTSPPPADFPWHKKYSDEEDEDLMADSPLLSRAFRAGRQ